MEKYFVFVLGLLSFFFVSDADTASVKLSKCEGKVSVPFSRTLTINLNQTETKEIGTIIGKMCHCFLQILYEMKNIYVFKIWVYQVIIILSQKYSSAKLFTCEIGKTLP